MTVFKERLNCNELSFNFLQRKLNYKLLMLVLYYVHEYSVLAPTQQRCRSPENPCVEVKQLALQSAFTVLVDTIRVIATSCPPVAKSCTPPVGSRTVVLCPLLLRSFTLLACLHSTYHTHALTHATRSKCTFILNQDHTALSHTASIFSSSPFCCFSPAPRCLSG